MVLVVAERVEALRRRQRVRFQVGLDGRRQRQRVDRIDAGATDDRAAAQLLQRQHLVRAPDALHAVAVQRHARQLAERLADVEVAQRRDLKAGHLVALRVQLRLFGGHLTLEGEMKPVADEYFGHAGGVLRICTNDYRIARS